jgi:hypothetical protein
MYIIAELNIQRMTMYKNISLDNTRKKKNKEKRKENTYFGDVCWSGYLLTLILM